jgi:hypothetical protein
MGGGPPMAEALKSKAATSTPLTVVSTSVLVVDGVVSFNVGNMGRVTLTMSRIMMIQISNLFNGPGLLGGIQGKHCCLSQIDTWIDTYIVTKTVMDITSVTSVKASSAGDKIEHGSNEQKPVCL